MDALPGEELPYEEVSRLPDDALRRLARETGRSLAQLHAVPAVEQFGHVRHTDQTRTGQRPSSDPAVLTVENPREDWQPYLRARVDQALDRHADSRFAELTPELRAWFDAGIERLDGPFEPVLGRNDHGAVFASGVHRHGTSAQPSQGAREEFNSGASAVQD